MSDKKQLTAAEISAKNLAATGTSLVPPKPQVVVEQNATPKRLPMQSPGIASGAYTKPFDNGMHDYKSGWDRVWNDNFWDNIWTDDFTNVPGMGWTGAVATGFQTVWDTVNWATSAGLLAANQKYWDNRGPNGNLWQDATNVSAGRAFQALESPVQDALGEVVTGERQGVYSADPMFNIADKRQQDAWFSNGPQSIGSGIIDAEVILLDPTFVVGKAAKIARFGSEAQGIIGLTSRNIRHGDMINIVGHEADDAVRFSESAGAAGRDNQLRVIGNTIAKSNFDELMEMPWIKNSPYAKELSAVGSHITDEVDGITFAAATMGNTKYRALLRTRAAAIGDAVDRITAADAYERAWLDGAHSGLGGTHAILLDDVAESNIDGYALLEDLIRRDNALSDAVSHIDMYDSSMPTAGGSWATGMKVAAAWRAGKAGRDIRYSARRGLTGAANADNVEASRNLSWMGRESAGDGIDYVGQRSRAGMSDAFAQSLEAGARAVAPVDDAVKALLPRSAPSVLETTYQLSANFRKVRVWSWISKQRGSGWLSIRGTDAGQGFDEVRAAGTDSKILRDDPAFLRQTYDDYIAAPQGAQDQWAGVNAMEDAWTRRIASGYMEGEPDEIARFQEVASRVYKYVDARRAKLHAEFRSRKGRAYGYDPETGDAIVLTPELTSQLESKIPMLDFRLMDSTLRRLAKPTNRHLWDAILEESDSLGGWSLKSHNVMVFADELNALWKASVLMRLGYTQRNVLEGWLRTWAVLGSIPALTPKNVARGTYRAVWGNPRAAAMNRSLSTIEKNLATVIADQRQAVLALDDQLSTVGHMGLPGGANNSSWLRTTHAARTEAQAALDDMLGAMERISARRAMHRKRYIGDEDAFAGELGELRRAQASNEQTQKAFFDTRMMRDVEALDERKWRVVEPGERQYWDELSASVVRMRNDHLADMAMRGASVEEMGAWIGSQAARKYRQDMRLKNDRQAAAHVARIHDRVHAYLPTEEARALAVGEEVPTGDQLRSVLGGYESLSRPPKPPVRSGETNAEWRKKQAQYDQRRAEYDAVRNDGRIRLSPIEGREIGDPAAFTQDPYHGFLEFMFKWLGSKPESALVRQPFYAEVYKRESASLFKNAEKQGLRDLDLDEQIAWAERIKETAHRTALKATNETLFTITRYSNPAAAFRFVSPFFAAWENSMRTWLRIITRDPSVAVVGAHLWDAPNRLGLVVDKDGNIVRSDPSGFMTGSENQYVLAPSWLAQYYDTLTGGFLLKSAKGAANVVSPGESPLLPGGGVTITAPVGLFLAAKPDEAATLRSVLGDKLYNQLAPFGEASGDLADTVLPSGVRKSWQYVQGESSQEYSAVVGAVAKDMMVEWNLNGGEESGIPAPTPAQVRERADAFYRFSTVASYVSPVALTRMSKFQVQIDDWNRLKADPAMTYPDKIKVFHDKWGDSYMPLVMTTTRSQVEGLDPTLTMFNTMQDNKGLVESLANIDPIMVSVLSSTVPADKFDIGVHNYWINEDMPGTPGTKWRSQMDAGSMLNATRASQMWSEYYSEKAQLKVALDYIGAARVDSAAARKVGLDVTWKQTEDRLAGKYKELWTALGPQAYADKAPKIMTAVALVANDEQFMQTDLGRSPVWVTIRGYLNLRGQAQQAVDAGVPKEQVQELFDKDVEQLRGSSLQFSDFYDNFLQYDKLTIAVPNG